MSIHVKKIDVDDLSEVVYVLNNLPEFDSLFDARQLYERLNKSECIVLLAVFAGKPIGCKIAYNRYFDGSIYSWLGGVLPQFRRQGVAKLLSERLEKEAKRNFFQAIRFKTRNKHRTMLLFALKYGFHICGFESKADNLESRIELIKYLNS